MNKSNDPNFFNTNLTEEPELTKRKEKALIQEDVIIELFRKHKTLTASEALNYSGDIWPITSVRRAITNLTTKGFLIKTDDTKIGIYGAKERYYQINNYNLDNLNHLQLTLFKI